MPLTIHHLQVSQSERIPWLCEELGLDYELKKYKRIPVLAPPEYKALHPLGSAPIIQDDDVTLAESCAIIEYICHKHANGKLFVHPSQKAYADFLYWWHWADGTFQAVLLRLMLARSAGVSEDDKAVDNPLVLGRFRLCLQQLNERFADHKWLLGDEFTAADIMIVFSLTTMRRFYPYSLKEYENISAYLKRIGERSAYRRAFERGDPGMEPVLGVEPPK